MSEVISRMIIAVVVLLVVGTLAFWSIDRDLPVKLVGVEILTPAVNPGRRVAMKITLERLRNDCIVHVDRILFDGTGMRELADDEDFNVSPGGLGVESFSESAPVPLWFAPGTGRFRQIRSYYCNPLQVWFSQPVVLRVPDAVFRIVPRSTPSFQ